MITNHAMVLQQELAQNCISTSTPLPSISAAAGAAFREGLEHFQVGDPGAALEAFSRSAL